MRCHLALAIAWLPFAAACMEEEPAAILDYSVLGATPEVPVRALQVFELNAAGLSHGPIALAWGDVIPLPAEFSITYHGDLPATFRLCAVGLGVEDELVHGLSDPIRLAFDERRSVVMPLVAVEPGGEVPEPCGPEVEPWPEEI
jgi:hypothetical protein